MGIVPSEGVRLYRRVAYSGGGEDSGYPGLVAAIQQWTAQQSVGVPLAAPLPDLFVAALLAAPGG
ncbi:hypothetical protein NITHO_1790004 [Nitrolancea hollandica Lb]|uniref:Uncharacterized protein n=1 Tax=Nitrolancea hollandica Lb TaxID=1129897 RepID=I4EED9_9BACT|nr:hypothetical protein NITHO_1790004 [Nitrolancea hollandica Lb]